MGKKNPKDIQVVKGYCLCEPAEDQSSESFVISDATPTPQWARVLSVGPKTWHEGIEKEYLPPCEKNDLICHSAMGYESIRVETKEYRLVPFGRVLATIKNEKKTKAKT